MIEPRIYRAAFIPAALAVILVMFSLESRPRPLAQGLAADVLFDGRGAATTTRAIVDASPDRRPGTVGDRRTAARVASAFRGRGFAVTEQRFDHAGRDLINVIGRRAGTTRRQIVVVAARDGTGVPDAAGSAGDTAALMELSRVFEGRPSRRTLVLASVDGSSLGEAGTSKLIGQLDDPSQVDGVVAISDLALRTGRRPGLVAWSNDTRRAGIGLERTAANSLREEVDRVATSASAAGQLARLAFPIGSGPQGVLLDNGYDAVRIAGDGEIPSTLSSGLGRVDVARLQSLGRAALRTVTALDQGRSPGQGPRSYVTAVSQVMPGWVLSVLAITLILPALVASVDAFARARRRRAGVGAWFLWLATAVAPFVLGLGVAHLLALADATPEPPAAASFPGLFPLDGPAIAVLAGLAVVVGLAWVGLRRAAHAADRDLRDAAAPGAAVAAALVLSLAALAQWLVNPYTALVLVPALHLWMLATLVGPPPPRRIRMLMVALGLLPPLLLAAYDLVVLGLDPLSGAWYLLMLVVGGHVSLASALLGCVLAGVLGSVLAIARSEHPETDAPREAPSLRGPASYAGPGSLGGTSSALRR